MLLDNQHVMEEIKKEIKNYFKTNDNKFITQNLWDSAKAILFGFFWVFFFIALSGFIRESQVYGGLKSWH